MRIKPERLFYIYLFLWFVVDMLQAIFMEIHADEAYYALYGEFLDWGYYDHPPMIALLTHLSSLLFSGNLAVRFFTVLLHIGTVWLVWKTIGGKSDEKGVSLFFVIASSMVMFVAYGFMTTPDAPLLFFVAAFLFFYKKFLTDKSWVNILMLSVTMAGMMYSKYHAALVIILVVLSNLSLLREWRFWVSGIMAIALFIPHILWQIEFGFPSLTYHLIARNQPFSWLFPLEYIPNQIAVFNPFILGLALYLCWRQRRSEQFERTLIFLIIGFIACFWFMTIKGHAEPHWTVAASVPMLILIYRHTVSEKRLARFALIFILPMTLLIVVARIVLCTDLLPERLGFNGKREYSEAIHSVCGDTPVVFTGSFQQTSLYRFFNKTDAVLLSSLDSRQTQFDILQLDKKLQGKPAYIMYQGKEYNINNHTFSCYYTESLQTVNRITINVLNSVVVEKNRNSVILDLEIVNPYDCDIDFQHKEFPVQSQVAYLIDNEYYKTECSLLRGEIRIAAGNKIRTQAMAVLPEDVLSQDIPVVICLENRICTSVNSKPFTIK